MEGDAVPQVLAFLKRADRRVAGAGGRSRRIVLDPGIGFGKTVEQNFALLARQGELLAGGYPLLAGWSRKSSLGASRVCRWRPPASQRHGGGAGGGAGRARGARARRAETVAALKVLASATGRDSTATDGDNGMSRKYFGTDGIRGTVGQAPITPDFVLRLAHAVGRVLKRSEDRPTVLIGKDTRISGYMLESALESGFNSAGVDVVLLGPLPTPGVAYLTRAQRASLGVVISASHNAFPDNGIKFFSAQGTKLPDAGSWPSRPRWTSPPCGRIRRRWARPAGSTMQPGATSSSARATFANDLTLKG
jgi:hypothetical protein